jgi:ADP-heptose:LPS heptosyltransferase
MHHLRAVEPMTTFRIIAAPSEQARGERIAIAGGATLVPTPNIRDALALVATADFVLTPDTSIAHAASAFQRPSVVLFVRGKSERWGLYGTVGQDVEHSEPTLDGLSAARVTDAIDRVMASALVTRG